MRNEECASVPCQRVDVELLPHDLVCDVPLHTYDAVQRCVIQSVLRFLMEDLIEICLERYRRAMLQQHALVCTVEGQQLHEAQVAQLIAATMAEECLSGVVQEFDSWYYSPSCLATVVPYVWCARCSDAVETIALREAEP